MADLDRGKLNDEALTTAIEQWENYGRAYLAQNAISADTVFPQPQGAIYDPAGDVALARDAIRTDLRQAEADGNQHRATVLRDFDAQLDKMVELYTLQAADQRAAGRDEIPELDREVFRRELGEHAAYFTGKVHPGAEIALPNDLFPELSSYHPGLWERHQQVFSATMGWSSEVRHPILDSTQYQPPTSASSAVRDHAAAVHAWALAEAKQARNAGQTARQDGLHDFADDVVMLLSQYEARATSSPGQGGEDFDRLDRHAFGDALEHVAGLGNEILTDEDAIVLPEQLRTGAYKLADDEYPEEVEPRLALRSRQLFPGLEQPVDAGEGEDALLDHLDNAEDWIRLRPPNLGHRPVIIGLSQQADRAVAAGDFELAARYRDLADQVAENAQFDEYAAIEGALRADDRRAHIAEQQTQTTARLQEQIARHSLVLPDSATDHDDDDGVAERDSEQGIDNAVRHAYDMILIERAAERQFDLGTPSDHDPVELDQLKLRLSLNSRMSGVTPHTPEQIDAALQRLTASQVGPRTELLDNNHHGERRSSVRITNDDQTDALVDESADAAAEADDSDWPADPASYLTARQRAVAEAMDTPDLGHARIAERLAQLAGEAAHAGDGEREERLGMLADDVRFAAVDDEYNAVMRAASSSDSVAELAQARSDVYAWVSQQAEGLRVELPADLTDDADATDGHSSTDQTSEPADSRHHAEQDTGRIDQLVSDAERAEMNAERLDDADDPAGAARLRAQARQWIQEAEALAASTDLGSIYTDTDTELERSGQAAGTETKGTSDLSQADVAKWRDRLAASVMEETARTDERLWSSSMFINVASPPVTAHAPVGETGTGSAAEGRILQPRVDFDSWLDQSQQYQVEQDDDASDAARRELDADLEAAEYNDPQRRREALAREVDDLSATAESGGDVDRAGRLRILASDTRHVPYDWDGESAITSEPWQVEASEAAEAEVSAAREATARESADKAEQDDDAGVEQRAPAREEVEQVDVDDRGDDAAEQVTAATETSACSVAISRARRSVEQVHERIEVDQQARDERDDELARWHADDRAASAADEQAIEDTGPALGDDQQV
ncbi:hypothetical protein [Kribbella endophytica]